MQRRARRNSVPPFSDMQIPPHVCASSAKSYLFSFAHAISYGDRNHPMSALRAELAAELARNLYLAKPSVQ